MTLAATSSQLPTVANRHGVTSAGSAPETPAHKKLRKAAQEFEGILISQLLGEFKVGLSSLVGGFPPGRVRYLELIGNSDLIDGLGQPRGAGNRENAGSSARAKFEPGKAKSGRGKD